MSLSHVAETITESATLKLNAEANRLRRAGEPVIHLGGGEPLSKPPSEALAAAAELLASGEIRYTPPDGTEALKQAIAGYTERFYGRQVAPEQVMASGGAKQAIMVALQAVVNPGERVVFPAPYWVSYPEMVRLTGGEPVAVRPADGSFQPQVADIERAVDENTKALIINSPNNPSGAVYGEKFIAGVVELCERRGLYLIMDDIYQRLIFDGREPFNCCRFAKDLSEDSRLILVNGVSKQYAMTGFRIGWAVASKRLIEVMTAIQGHQTSGPSIVGQNAAAAALNGEQARSVGPPRPSSVSALRQALESARAVVVEGLRSIPDVRLSLPGGTFYAFPDFSAYQKSSLRLAEFLLDKVRVVTVPGIEFGWDGCLRISFCRSADDIRQGIERIKWALDPNAPRETEIGGHKFVRDWD